jgi:hypothetical protein
MEDGVMEDGGRSEGGWALHVIAGLGTDVLVS